jgi:hypothetical protein
MALSRALSKVRGMALWKALWTELSTALCPWTPLTSLSTPCHPLLPLAARPPTSALD